MSTNSFYQAQDSREITGIADIRGTFNEIYPGEGRKSL